MSKTEEITVDAIVYCFRAGLYKDDYARFIMKVNLPSTTWNL